jgi:hypothetical protein
MNVLTTNVLFGDLAYRGEELFMYEAWFLYSVSRMTSRSLSRLPYPARSKNTAWRRT